VPPISVVNDGDSECSLLAANKLAYGSTWLA